MNKKIFLALLVFFFTLSIFFLPVKNLIAQETIGKLAKFKGEVELVREGASVPIKPDMPILSGDRIKTEKGLAEVKFKDGSLLKIRPRSNMVLTQTKKKRKFLGVWTKEYLSRTINIKQGEAFAEIKPREDLKTEFESPSVITAVRGTTLTVGVDPATGETTISVDVGVTEAYTVDGWTMMTLETGESVAVHIDPATGAASVHSYSGTIEVRAANTTTTVEAGETVAANVDPETGTASIMGVTGTVEVTVGNTVTTVEEGEVIAGNVDPDTGAANVFAITGTVETTSAGETVTIPEGQGTTAAPGEAPAPPTTPPAPPPAPPVAAPPPPPAPPTPPPPPPPPPVPPASPSE
jgi:quercetin dioxygenase-like cupin family protein